VRTIETADSTILPAPTKRMLIAPTVQTYAHRADSDCGDVMMKGDVHQPRLVHPIAALKL